MFQERWCISAIAAKSVYYISVTRTTWSQVFGIMTSRSTRLRKTSLQPYLWKHRLHTLIIISLGISQEVQLDNAKDEQTGLPKCWKSLLKFPSSSTTSPLESLMWGNHLTLSMFCPTSLQGTIQLHSWQVKDHGEIGRYTSNQVTAQHKIVTSYN